MRDTEFQAAALALLTEIRNGVVRVAEACERAERWTTADPVGAQGEPGPSADCPVDAGDAARKAIEDACPTAAKGLRKRGRRG